MSRPLLLFCAVALLVRVLLAAHVVNIMGPTATRSPYVKHGILKPSLRGGMSGELDHGKHAAKPGSKVTMSTATVVGAPPKAAAAGLRRTVGAAAARRADIAMSTAAARIATTTARPLVASDADARAAREQEELEEELVREVRAESRGARDDKGEREEWASSAHLHRKYDVHTKSARARARKRARARAHARMHRGGRHADEESSL